MITYDIIESENGSLFFLSNIKEDSFSVKQLVKLSV